MLSNDFRVILGCAIGMLPRILHAERIVEKDEMEVRLAGGVGITAADEARHEQLRFLGGLERRDVVVTNAIDVLHALFAERGNHQQ